MSTAFDILNAITSRCKAILVSGGFATDMGAMVIQDSPQFNPDEVTSSGLCVVYDTAEENEDSSEIIGDQFTTAILFTVEGHIRVGANNAVALAHDMITDIKTAVLIADDRTLGGLSLDLMYQSRETQYPDRASDLVSVQLVFYTQYMETYGNP